MSLLIDHVMIVTRDLDAASARYRALGLDVAPGGRHEGRGTHNALIRFGLDYLELLAVEDEAAARARGGSALVLLDLLATHEEALSGYALRTDDIEALAERFRRTGLPAEGPFTMGRRRPDGTFLGWRLLIPGGVSARRPWPFIIQWDDPDPDRLRKDPVGRHPGGATAIGTLSLVVRDGPAARRLYTEQLGLDPEGTADRPDLAARGETYRVGTARLEVLTPTGDGPAATTLARDGEGLVAVTLVDAAGRVVAELGSPLPAGAVRTPATPD